MQLIPRYAGSNLRLMEEETLKDRKQEVSCIFYVILYPGFPVVLPFMRRALGLNFPHVTNTLNRALLFIILHFFNGLRYKLLETYVISLRYSFQFSVEVYNCIPYFYYIL